MAQAGNLPTDAFQAFTVRNDPTQPIPASLFAAAIKDLPLDTLYAKAAELQNSISKLLDSNIQMTPFAEQGDVDCEEAIAENDAVIKRTEERIGLCKTEAERRGLPWSGHSANTDAAPKTNGHAEGLPNGNRQAAQARAPSGRLTDDELRRQLQAQMGEEDEDGGVHL